MADLSIAMQVPGVLDMRVAIAAVVQQVEREMAEANAAQLRVLADELQRRAIAELVKEQTWP